MTIKEFKQKGGEWLGKTRSWIQKHCLNGSTVKWGTDTPLAHDLTVRDVYVPGGGF